MTIQQAKGALKKQFGYDSFRPMQEQIIQSVYDKKNTLVLMPTGGGKSICYQIPAITLPGVCVVISPLIALMKDQVESLRSNGIAAAYLNSSVPIAEQQAIEEQLLNDELHLIYVSPEKIVSRGFTDLLRQLNINLFAIDEAHCISNWGHDFRPEYTQLTFLRRQFKQVPLIALTATADSTTRRDIVNQLGIENAQVFISSFDRPNISLEVRPGQKRMQQILDFVKSRPNTSGIVYCLSRKGTEEVAANLLKSGIKADFYHAGLNSQERSSVQEKFIKDEVPIVCATVAFGMGIDKSNVRWIIHYNMPQSMEGYYQEIGRAGRDGLKSETILFYSYRDVMMLRDILTRDNSNKEGLKLAKLDRIQQYADSLICRRKILLSYFGEVQDENCNNCDVCKNPPKSFDGTILSQKALSALARTGERVGISLLIDILRGSKRREVLERGYDKIKTYGAGGDISAFDWQQLIQQMINIGLMEVAFDQKNILRLTPEAKAVLFKGRKVELVRMKAIKEKMEERSSKAKVVTQRQRARNELFDLLRKLRRDVAVAEGKPPYIVFSDATLEEMAAEKPINESELMNISGVGEFKLNKYGAAFLKVITTYMESKAREGQRVKGASQVMTLQLFNRGLSVTQISIERNVSEMMIYNHLLELYNNDNEIKISRIVSQSEIKAVVEAKDSLPPRSGLKEIYQKLNEKVAYHKIRFALAFEEKHSVL